MLELWPTLISYALFMHHPIVFRGAGDVHGMLRVDPKLVLEDLRSDKSYRSVMSTAPRITGVFLGFPSTARWNLMRFHGEIWEIGDGSQNLRYLRYLRQSKAQGDPRILFMFSNAM